MVGENERADSKAKHRHRWKDDEGHLPNETGPQPQLHQYRSPRKHLIQ